MSGQLIKHSTTSLSAAIGSRPDPIMRSLIQWPQRSLCMSGQLTTPLTAASGSRRDPILRSPVNKLVYILVDT